MVSCGSTRRLPAGQAEVHDDRLAAPVEHDVGRLQVAVDDPVVVGVLHGPGDACGRSGRPRRGSRNRPGPTRRGERFASNEGHGQEVGAVDLADVVDGADVGVLEGGGRLGLADEPGGGGRAVAGQAGDLEGDRAVEDCVVGQVDGPHAAGPERGADPVAAEPGAGLEGGGRKRLLDGRRREGGVRVGGRQRRVPRAGGGVVGW